MGDQVDAKRESAWDELGIDGPPSNSFYFNWLDELWCGELRKACFRCGVDERALGRLRKTLPQFTPTLHLPLVEIHYDPEEFQRTSGTGRRDGKSIALMLKGLAWFLGSWVR